MAIKIASAGLRTSSLTTRFWDAGSTTAVWSADHYGNCFCICADSSGNIYTGGTYALDLGDFSQYTVRKYDIDGNLLWKRAYLGDTVRGIACNDAGDVVVVGNRASSKTTIKYNAAGTEQWSADHGDTVRGVFLDSSGNVYTVGNVSSSVTLRKYNSSGTEQWSANHGDQTNAVYVNSSGDVFICGNRSSSSGFYDTRKYNSSGSLQWSRSLLNTHCTGIVVDSSENTYVCSANASSGLIRKHNSSGTFQWSQSLGELRGVQLDKDGNVFVCGATYSSYELRKYNNSGTLQDSFAHGTDLYGLVVFEPAQAAQIPALALGFSLGTPSAGQAHSPPALPLSFALAVPTPTAAPVPPLGDGQVIYRCYLTGSALIELPIESIECRRRRNQSTWLLLSVPTVTTAQRAAILAAVNIGQLVIYSGLRSSDGTETMGEFLRATLTETNETLEPWNAGMILTARVSAVLETLQTRTLEGVYQRSSSSGRKSISCVKVNPVLRPGDTVTDGDWSFVADSVTYKIYAFSSDMTVLEAS